MRRTEARESEKDSGGFPPFTHREGVDFSALKMLKTILGLLLLVLIGQAVIVWQNERAHALILKLQEQIVPSMTLPVTVDPPGPQGPITIPVTTTQGEFDPEETENEWIDRTKATCANVKARLEAE